MDTWLCIDTMPLDDGTVVQVVGEIDIATADRFAEALCRQVLPNAVVVVDLAGVTFMSVAGARILHDAHERLGALGGRLIVWRPHRCAAHLLRVSDFGAGMVIHDRCTLPALRDE